MKLKQDNITILDGTKMLTDFGDYDVIELGFIKNNKPVVRKFISRDNCWRKHLGGVHTKGTLTYTVNHFRLGRPRIKVYEYKEADNTNYC